MKSAAILLALTSLSVLGSTAAKADTIDNYSFAVTLSSYSSTYNGQTYTGTFQVDEQTGGVTNFATNLLGGSYTNANLGDVATFTSGLVSSLHFGLTIQAPDGAHSSGFTSGFPQGFGDDPNNYFGFLDPQTYYEGQGTPVFTFVSTAATPEPSSLILLASGVFGMGAVRFRSRFARSAK